MQLAFAVNKVIAYLTARTRSGVVARHAVRNRARTRFAFVIFGIFVRVANQRFALRRCRAFVFAHLVVGAIGIKVACYARTRSVGLCSRRTAAFFARRARFARIAVACFAAFVRFGTRFRAARAIRFVIVRRANGRFPAAFFLVQRLAAFAQRFAHFYGSTVFVFLTIGIRIALRHARTGRIPRRTSLLRRSRRFRRDGYVCFP